ncbi:MAG: alpha/beta fold hydrolase [Pseudolabrys sp.]
MIAPALYHKIAGSGPHVVLLHPVGLDLTFLEPVAAELCRSFTVLSVDLRGHGHSPASPPARSLDDYADDVHVFLGARGFAPAAVAGFSFGGMVAQHLALKYPKDVSALAICACPSTLKPENRVIAAERGAQAEREGIGVVLDATLDRWFTPEFRASGAADAARDRLLSDNVMAWAQAWRAMAAIDTSARLGAIQVPTLCLAGEIDKSSPPEIVAAIAEQIAGARFAVIPGAPHMLFIEQPRAVARVIGDFLAGL